LTAFALDGGLVEIQVDEERNLHRTWGMGFDVLTHSSPYLGTNPDDDWCSYLGFGLYSCCGVYYFQVRGKVR